MSEQAHINHQNGQGAIPLLKVALAIGILAHVAGFAAFRVVDTAAPPELKQQAFIRFQNSTAQDRDRFFEEQAMLLDSEPLFLPTQWNYAARVRTETPQLAPPPPPFGPFAETIRLRRVDFFGDRPIESAVNSPQLIANILSNRADLLSSLYFPSTPSVPLTERTAFLRFNRIGSQPLVIERIVRLDSEPGVTNGRLWEPAELLLQVDSAGRLGDPVIVATSGSEEKDAEIVEWVTAPESIRNLPPGYYRVVAGP